MLRIGALALATIGFILTPAASADEAAQNRLTQAKEVLQKVSAVQYEIKVAPQGAIGEIAPTIEGSMLMQAAPGLPIAVRFQGKGVITRPDSEAPVRFRAAFDGETIRSVDFELGVVQYAGLIPGADALLVGSYDMLLDIFVTENPLNAEINSYQATLEGDGVVDGEPVDVVLVQYQSDVRAGRSRWHFAKSDGLPRRVEQMFHTATGEAAVVFTLSNINVEPTVDAGSFMFDVPEGFVESEFDGSGLLPVGVSAPDWTLRDPDGKDLSLADLRGKVVLMDFWATWCAPCKTLMPSIQAIHEEFADEGLVVLGVITDEPDTQTALDYVDTSGFTYRQLTNGETIFGAYRAMSLPTLYLIGRDGRIAFRGNIINEADLHEAVKAALAQNVQ